MFRITEDPSSGRLVQCLAKKFIQLTHNMYYGDAIKITKYLKVLQHVSDHRGPIIREASTVLG